MTIEQIKEAMLSTHDRNHAILGAMLVYLHSTAADPFERVAVVNHALDAALNFAMMVTPSEQREDVRKQLIRRMSETNLSIYPEPKDLIEREAFNELFRTGLNVMVHEPMLMNMLGAMLAANAPSRVNDTVN
jgi:hypothetical protein